MVDRETVLSGADHPQTRLRVLQSPAGFFLGFTDENGSAYSRESVYFSTATEATAVLLHLRT